MGEAAEWEIWRRYGVDISDDGYLENPPKRKRGRPKKESTKPAGLGQDLEGYEEPRSEREYARYTERRVLTGPENLQQITKGTENMSNINTREAVALIQLHQGARLYGVKFMAEGFVKPDQKTYTYKDTQGLALAFNDLVIVEARDAYAIAQVVQLDVSPSAAHVELGKVRHIVQKIDLEQHHARLSRENNAVEKLAMAEVNERLEKYRAQLGGTRFGEVEQLLSWEEPRSAAPSERLYRLDAFLQIHDNETGDIVGFLGDSARGKSGKLGIIVEVNGARRFVIQGDSMAQSHLVLNSVERNA